MKISRRSTFGRLMAVGSVLWLLSACTAQPVNTVPSDQALNKSAISYTQLGFAYLERNNSERAKRAMIKALSLQPDFADALHGMALIYQQEGEYKLAEKHFRQALSESPEFSTARNNFAAFLYSQQRYDEACEQLELTVADTLYFNRQQAFENLGLCEVQRQHLPAAETAFKKALQLNNKSEKAMLELADIYRQQNHPLDAWRYLQKHFEFAKPTERSLRLGIFLADSLGKKADKSRWLAELANLKQ